MEEPDDFFQQTKGMICRQLRVHQVGKAEGNKSQESNTQLILFISHPRPSCWSLLTAGESDNRIVFF